MEHPKMGYTYVGVDSHKESHTAVLIDCFFEKIGEVRFDNLPSAFPGFLERVRALASDGTEPLFGLEDVTAYGRTLAVFLSESGCGVKHANAGLVAAERKARGLPQKTDAIDAECAARVLLSRLGSLQDADPQDKYWVLRALVARRWQVVRGNTSLKNHLHALITTHYPNYGGFFSTIDRKASLAFLKAYPSPHSLEGAAVGDVARVLSDASEKRLGEKRAAAILETVRQGGYAPVRFQGVRDAAVRSAIRQFESNVRELAFLDSELAKFLAHFDQTLTSMVGIEAVTAASLLALIGDVGRFPTAAKLAQYAGVAPLSRDSGKGGVRFANRRGNRQLNSVLFNLAVRVSSTAGSNNKAVNPIFYEYYHRKMSEGKTKRQALKCVQRRLVNIIWTMLTNGEEYVNPPMANVPKDGGDGGDNYKDNGKKNR